MEKEKALRPNWLRALRPGVFFFVTVLLQELFLKLYCFGRISLRGLLFTLLFTLPIAMFLGLVCAVCRPKMGRGLLVTAACVIGVWMATQTVYFHQFETFMSLSSLLHAAMVAGDFGGMAVMNTLRCWFPVTVLMLPVGAAFVLRRRLLPDRVEPGHRWMLHWFGITAAVQLALVLLVTCLSGGPLSLSHIYSRSDSAQLMVTNFGVLTNTRRELQRLVFGVPAKDIDVDELLEQLEQELALEEEQPPVQIPLDEKAQVMDIDFTGLWQAEEDEDLRVMHRHFAGVEPTLKNDWTGRFAGKNLVWIVAEAFSSLALDPELTPTLYRLSGQGIVCRNFYTPLWGLSTSDGEYVTTTGLIPKSGAWSYLQSAENHMPFGFGNQFGRLGYRTLAFHNHSHTYYGRDRSYPNMGYEFYALGNGLEVARTWPESDLEMMELSVPMYAQEEAFMVYYLTVSGHLDYNVDQNDMAAKHWDKVSHLPMSEEARAYLATQIELDRAVESLLAQLDQAGQLEDTVIVISGDHYPYGLQDEQLVELLGHELQDEFERYKSTLILWSADLTQPVYVDKYCSSLDVMPTLANLFGLEYDSRLMAGRDILSDAPGLVMFYNYSFLTDRGAWSTVEETFTSWDGPRDNDEAYVEQVMDEVRDRFRYSELILDEDYYRAVFPAAPSEDE
ncbi:MAG: sulfatase-like hydrolase/transferase [Oscillospiraceae bacterium]|nr:sulfatase-like hydrolase/transferase [Oscillospiraceae bacterium]